MPRPPHVLITTALAGALLAGCSPQPPRAAAPAPAPAASSPAETPEAVPAYDWAPEPSDEPDLPEVPEGRRDRFRPDWMPGEREAPLGLWLYYAVDPPGRRREIALRFAQALQRHDDFAAGLELSTRQNFVNVGDPQLHAIFADVRHHAGLEHGAPCTTSRDLDADSVVVTCGSGHVVVHLSDMSPGVVMSGWFTHADVYSGPHTHAYTDIET